LGKGGWRHGDGFGTGAPARFVYTIGLDLKCGLKTAIFVQFSLQGGSRTCQSSEKFFLLNILGRLARIPAGIKKPARRLVP
jgi:hypothetical protein